MSREYKMPDGTPVPAELQDKIAHDVRLFDSAQEPGARAAVSLRKIGSDIPRLRGAIAELSEIMERRNKIAERQATAFELQILFTMGYSSRQIRESQAGKSLVAIYGMGDPEWPNEA